MPVFHTRKGRRKYIPFQWLAGANGQNPAIVRPPGYANPTQKVENLYGWAQIQGRATRFTRISTTRTGDTLDCASGDTEEELLLSYCAGTRGSHSRQP